MPLSVVSNSYVVKITKLLHIQTTSSTDQLYDTGIGTIGVFMSTKSKQVANTVVVNIKV